MIINNHILIKSDDLRILKNYSLPETSNNEKEFEYKINAIGKFQKSDGGNIILLNQGMFYFFDNKGEKIFHQNFYSEVHDDLTKNIYTIIPYKKVLNKYYFILSHMNSSKQLVLKYYEIDITVSTPYLSCKATKNEKINYLLENRKKIGNEYSCIKMRMENFEQTDIITCFYIGSYKINRHVLIGVYYEIEKNENSFSFIKKGEYYFNNINAFIIKSVTSPDLHSALVCYIKKNGESECLSFSISNGFSSTTIFTYTNPYNIKKNSFADCLVYDENNSQYVYIISLNENHFKEIRFDKTFTKISNDNNEIKYISEKCEFLRIFSYLYFNSVYHIIADCQNGKNFKLIISELQTKINLRKTTGTEGNNADPANPGSQENENQDSQNNKDDDSFEKKETDKSKSEVFEDFNGFVKDFVGDSSFEVGKSYFIESDDFSVLVKPAGSSVDQNITQVDFSNCEKILREKNNLDDSYNLTIVQISTKSDDERVLTDTIQYKVYDEDYNEMDLSVCSDIKISINYVINDNDILNTTKLALFKNMDIDIINLQDDFFNDICYAYSDNSDDMILSDRRNDIYVNVSLCDSGCTFVSFDIDTNMVNCTCDVKEDVEEDADSTNYATPVISAFFDSNFGVTKCYNLVFSHKNKVKNIGFWVMTVLLVAQVPFLILYIFKGLMPVLNFVQDTMYRNGYLSTKNELYETIKKNDKDEKNKNNKSKNRNKDGLRCSLTVNNVKKSNDSEQIQDGELINYTKDTIRQNSAHKKNEKVVKQNLVTRGENPPRKNNDTESEKSAEKTLLSSKKKNINKPTNIEKIIINQIVDVSNDKNSERSINSENKKENDSKKNENNYKTVKETTDDFVNLDSKRKVFQEEKNKNKTSEKNLKNENENKYNKARTLQSKEMSAGEKSEQNFKEKYISRVNEEENLQKHPGFYSLIKLNLNEEIENIPMESKYVLNNYTYDEAVLYEKRSIWRLYYIYLLSKEDILNTFFFEIPFQLQQLRICMFIFNYSIDIALNAFFYLSDNISDRYHYSGANKYLFTLINNLTITLISTIVTMILVKFLDSLIQSNDKLQTIFENEENELKNKEGYEVSEERKKVIEKYVKNIIKCLKIKIAVFFIAEFLIMFFFWYYVTAFCHVYHNTQSSWIIDCLVSFVYKIVINAAVALGLTITYIISVKYKLKWLYKISMFMY